MENYSLLLFITFSFMTLFLVECQVNRDKNPRPRGRSQVGFEDLEWIRREKDLKGFVDKEDKSSTKIISNKNIRSWLQSKVNFTDLEWIRHEKKFLGVGDQEDNKSGKSALKKCKTISLLFTDLWCNTNCMSGFCPKTFCKC